MVSVSSRLALGGAVLALAGAGLVVGSFAATVGLADLLRGVDHGDELLGDFHFYYLPQGEALRAGGGQIHGFFATPFVAALMAWLAGLGTGAATVVWSVVTALSLAVVVAASGALLAAGRRAGWIAPLLLGAALTASVPLLHVARWGQVSGPSAAMLLIAAVLRAHPSASGAALGVAIALKPWAALAVVVTDGRRAVTALAVAAALVLVVPMPWLGLTGPVRFTLDVAADVAASEQYLAVDPNSQSLVHVFLRGIRVPAAERGGWYPWLAPVALVVASVHLVRLRRLRSALGGAALPAALLALVAVTPTAWPSDLLLVIPVAAAAFVIGGELRSGLRRAVVTWLPLVAIVLLSWPVQRAFGGHRWHGGLGIPLLAVLCTAVAVHAAGSGSSAADAASRDP